MASRKTAHGGKRLGAGRTPLSAQDATVTFGVRMTSAQRRKLAKLGGAAFIRKKIDAATLST